MASVETILSAAVPPQSYVHVDVPGLRHGDITDGSGVVTVGGFPQPDVGFVVDYQGEAITVQNLSTNPWAQGAALVLSWEGIPLEAVVTDHEARIAVLEAGGGGASTGNTFDDPVYFKGDSASDYGIYIDSPDKDYGAGILANLGGARRWEIMLGDGSPESLGTNQGSNFEIGRYSDFNQYMDAPFRIDRKSGSVIIKIPECADSPAAGVAGVPIGGLYHTSGNVKVRLY